MREGNVCYFIPGNTSGDSVNIINFVRETEDIRRVKQRVRSYFALNLVISGEGKLHTSGKCLSLRRGDLFLVFPGVPYTVESTEGLQYMYIGYLGPRGVRIAEKLQLKETEPVCAGFENLIPFWEASLEELSVANQEMLCESVLLYTFSVLANRRFSTEEEKVSDLVGKVVIYIEEHFADRELSMGSVCERFSYSRTHLSALLKKHLGMNFRQYLNTIRIQQACALLDRGERNMTAVADSCGFADSMYFSKVFRQKMGESPRDYLKHTYKD